MNTWKRLKRKFRYNPKKGFFSLFLFVVVLSISLGYAYLNTTLQIDGTSQFKKASWDIHFANIQVKEGSVTPTTEATITNDTTVSFEATLDNPGDFYEFNVDVVNEGTMNAKIDSFEILPVLTTEQQNYFNYQVNYVNGNPLQVGDPLLAGDQETLQVVFAYKELDDLTLYPNTDQSFEISVTIHYVQDSTPYDPENSVIRIIYSTTDKNAFRSDAYRNKIKTITLSKTIKEPDNVIESWDYSQNQDGNVMAYITTNQDDNTMYDLYIQGNGHLYANEDSSYLFSNLRGVDAIIGIDNLDTSRVETMYEMFFLTGYNSNVFTLDLGDNFDTSNVTDMSNMFESTGYNSSEFILNLGTNFETSNVTNMNYMFYNTGRNCQLFTLNLGEHFDTSNVTSMRMMFRETGKNGSNFTLNLGNHFDTSKVTDMRMMFYHVGDNSPSFTLNLGNQFNTSNVTDMGYMFCGAGISSEAFTLNLGNQFDTKNVTTMESMFASVGQDCSVFTLNLGNNFDTSNVTTMDSMFEYAGLNSNVFTLDLGNKFDTSKVTNMNSMFTLAGNNSPLFTLNLGNHFDTSNVTSMVRMFDGAGKMSSVYTLNLGNQFDTSKVTMMQAMFANAGYSNPNFTLDLGTKFNTSNVEDMGAMFAYVGYSNPNFTLNLGSLFTTSNVTKMNGAITVNTYMGTGNIGMFNSIGLSNANLVLDLSNFDFSNVTEGSGFLSNALSSTTIYVKDSAAQNWVITNGGSSNLSTANVLIKT